MERPPSASAPAAVISSFVSVVKLKFSVINAYDEGSVSLMAVRTAVGLDELRMASCSVIMLR